MKKKIYLQIFVAFFSLFIFYSSFVFKAPVVHAATVTWTSGGGDGLWETGANWSTGVVPTSADDVVIDNTQVTLSSGQTANFGTLTIGQGTNFTTFILTGNIGTGGSITISNSGSLSQSNTTTQTISGDLVVQNGGSLTHTTNGSTHANSVNFTANNIDIQSGGSVQVAGRGYSSGFLPGMAGNGPGGGGGRNAVSPDYGGGGAHAGNGTASVSGLATGGTAYCDISNVSTIGSAGGNGSAAPRGGRGGGLIILQASSTLTINGTISANAGNGSATGGGGGGGGGIKLVANTISGTPTVVTAVGGNGSGNAGNGGGGCVQIRYRTSSSITTSTVNGGSNGTAADGGNGLFSLAQIVDNSAPTTTSVIATQTSSTTVRLVTTVSDADSNTTTLYVDYSLDGSTWASSTLGTVSVSQGTASTSTGRITGIGTDLGSVTVTSTWLISSDIPNTEDSSVYIRVTPNDGTVNGSATTSASFMVDTKDPSKPGDLAVGAVSASTTSLLFPDTTSSDLNFSEYKIYYSSSTPVTELGSVLTSSTVSNLGDVNFGSTTSTIISGLSPNQLYFFKLYAYDTWGHSTSTAEVSTTTLASVPTSLSASAYGDNQISLNWSGDGTLYFVQNVTNGTDSGWISGTIFRTPTLTCNTSYVFRIKAQNSFSAESEYSSTITGTTAACSSGGGGGGGAGGGSSGGGSIAVLPKPSSNAFFPAFIKNKFWSVNNQPAVLFGFNMSDASYVAISVDQNFSNSAWVPYQSEYAYVLNSTVIPEKFYVKFRSAAGGETEVYTVLTPNSVDTNSVGDMTDGPIEKVKIKSPALSDVSLKPESLIVFSNLPQSVVLRGKKLGYTYSFTNVLPSTVRLRILRTLETTNGKVIMSSSGIRTLKKNASFSFSPSDKLNKKMAVGGYVVKIYIFDKTGKQVDQNGFDIVVK
jgi:hypothetical protein